MNVFAITEGGEKVMLPQPVSLCINCETDVPADDITITFAMNSVPPLAFLTVTENGSNIFMGIVDEQEKTIGADGTLIKITGRSMAALLLDNEAKPTNYTNLSDEVLFYNHIEPYGLTGFLGDDASYIGNMSIDKGVTQWQVVEDYCGKKYNTVPRINEEGIAVLNGSISQKKLLFSNTIKRGMPYVSCKIKTKRHSMLSHIYVRTSPADGYTTTLINTTAVKKGVMRRRYLNVADMKGRTLDIGDKMIEKSNQGNLIVTLCCPCGVLGCLGAMATVDDIAVENGSQLTISKVRYVLSSQGQYTYLTLKEVLCG